MAREGRGHGSRAWLRLTRHLRGERHPPSSLRWRTHHHLVAWRRWLAELVLLRLLLLRHHAGLWSHLLLLLHWHANEARSRRQLLLTRQRGLRLLLLKVRRTRILLLHRLRLPEG